MDPCSILVPVICGLLIYWVLSEYLAIRNLPPGPWGWPIFGNIFSMSTGSLLESVKIYKEKYGDMFSMPIGNFRVIVFTDYKSIIEVLKRQEFTGRPDFKVWEDRNRGVRNRGILFCDGPVWQEQRRFALKGLRDFGFGKENMEGLIIFEMEELVKLLKTTEGTPIDMSSRLNASVFNSLWYILTGKRFELNDPLFEKLVLYMARFLSTADVASPAFFLFNYVKHIMRKRMGIIRTMRIEIQEMLIEQRKEHEKTYKENVIRDFIDCYIQEMREVERLGKVKSPFYKEEGSLNCLILLHDLFIAGAETTSTTLTWGILFLAKYPEIQKKLQKEIDNVIGKNRAPCRDDKENMVYTEAVINEIHRKASLVPFNVYHKAIENTSYKGYYIPKGTLIFPSIYFAHHDKKFWGDPDVFRPERFIDETGTKILKKEALIPFSTGKRICLGEALARDSLFIFLTGLLQKFTFELDVASKDHDLTGPLRFIRSPTPFKVILKSR